MQQKKQLKMHPLGPYYDPNSDDQNYDNERSSSQHNSLTHLINQSNHQILDESQFSKIDHDAKIVSKVESRFQSLDQQKPKTKISSKGAHILEGLYGEQKITINPLCQSHNFDHEDSYGGDSRSLLFAKGSAHV